MVNCNQMIFDTDCNKDALDLAQKFVRKLLEHNCDSLSDFNDIHIYQEESLIIVEWCQIFYDDDFPQDHFKLIDTDHLVVKSIVMPNNSILYIFPEDDEAELISNWYRDNPDFIKDKNK